MVFYVGDLLIERPDRRVATDPHPGLGEGGSSLGILLGTILDGIPESAVLGMSLVVGGEVSVALLVGIWIANLPESMAASDGMLASGWSRPRVRTVWTTIVAISAIAAALGYLAVDRSSQLDGAFIQAFAAGALLTMIADEMAPEAYERSSIHAGLATTAGFALAGLLTTLE